MAEGDRFKEIVAEVAAAYFSNSHVPQSEISSVIREIAASLNSLGEATVEEAAAEPAAETAPEAQVRATPAQIRKSITPAALVSFEDGKPYKTLKRHLATRGLTPEQYREKWNLPRDYPMVSPNYSAARSQMAKSLGLGQLGRQQRAAAPAPAKRGRRAKAVAAK